MSYSENDISELKQRVAKLERQVALLMGNQGLPTPGVPAPAVSPEIMALVRRGKKIQAIKLYREQHRVGLREAKEFIDSLM